MSTKLKKSAQKFNLVDFISENKMPIIIVLIVVAFFGFIIWQSESSKINLDGIEKSKMISNTDQSGGIEEHLYPGTSKDAKVTIVEYGDLQCPSCATMNSKMKAIAEKYGEKISIIYRNFPLSGRANSLSAAAAAESAGLQGKYWEMHDLLYENQSEWSAANATERTELYKKYAEKAGVTDLDKFISDMKSSNISKKINFDKNLGLDSKITGTPSFFINGQEIKNDVWGDDNAFAAKIDELLK